MMMEGIDVRPRASLRQLKKKIKKIFLCWSDCQKEMFEILVVYLNAFKHFSFSAAKKYLKMKRKY